MPFIETAGTQAMHWLARCVSFLQNVSERSSWKFFKLVALLLTFPCAKLHDLCFEFVYSLQVRRLRFLRSQQVRLGFEDRALQGYLSVVDGCGSSRSIQALRNIKRGLQAANTGTNFGDHDFPRRVV